MPDWARSPSFHGERAFFCTIRPVQGVQEVQRVQEVQGVQGVQRVQEVHGFMGSDFDAVAGAFHAAVWQSGDT